MKRDRIAKTPRKWLELDLLIKSCLEQNSRTELAKKLEVDQRTLTRWLSRESFPHPPQLKKIEALAVTDGNILFPHNFSVSIDDLRFLVGVAEGCNGSISLGTIHNLLLDRGNQKE